VLRVRLLMAACIISPILALMWADHQLNFQIPGIWLFPLAGTIWMMAGAELRQMIGDAQWKPAKSVFYGSLASVIGAPGIYVYWSLFGGTYPADCPLGFFGWPFLGLMVATGLAFVWEMFHFRAAERKATLRVAGTLLACCYLGIPFAFLVGLRLHEGNSWGMVSLLSLLVIVKLSDAGAYGAGRLWGRRKLAPRLSPNKTVAGAIGGVVIAALAAVLFRWTIVPWMLPDDVGSAGGWIAWAIYGCLLAVSAMGGDLAESLVKRDLGCKDSSRWLPGLGGMLDLIDSVLFAAPIAYFLWIAGMIGPS